MGMEIMDAGIISLFILCAILVALLVAMTVLRLRDRASQRQLDAATMMRETESRRAHDRLMQQVGESEKVARVLEQRWQRSERILAATGDMVLVYGIATDGMPGHYTQVNPAACARLEYTPDALMAISPLEIELVRGAVADKPMAAGKEAFMALPNSELLGRENSLSVRSFQALIKQLQRDGRMVYRTAYVSKSGCKIPVEVTASLLEGPNGIEIVCLAHEIAERLRLQALLHETELRERDFVTNSPVGIALYNIQKQLINVNPACLKVFGAADRETFAHFDPFDNPFFPPVARTAVSRGEITQCEMVLDFDVIRQQGLYVTGRAGRVYLEVHVHNLGHDRNYNPRGYLVHVQDISSRRQAEEALRTSEKQLRQAQKMEAIGTLAGGIAHDFNNILTPILGYSEMGLELNVGIEGVKGFMREIQKAARRAKELVEQILTFSRQTDAALKPIHLIPIVKEVVKQQRAALPETVEIQLVTKTERDLVMAGPTQIHQILTNLCTNAGYVMKMSGGHLEVRLTLFGLNRWTQSEFPDVQPGKYVRISVKDTGCGMDRATLDRIFEPFFTTKPSGEGTGMGLAVVHGIVRSLHGGIAVESEVGKGSTFHVVLPVIEESVVSGPEASAPIPQGNECVMFVDDEPIIIRMAEQMLNALGYQAVVMNQSVQALALFEQNPQRFDIVITDHVMPELTGADMAERMLKIRPDLPVIMCTGFSEKLSAEQALARGIRHYLMKPVAIRELAETIRLALSSKRATSASAASPSPTA